MPGVNLGSFAYILWQEKWWEKLGLDPGHTRTYPGASDVDQSGNPGLIRVYPGGSVCVRHDTWLSRGEAGGELP